MTRTSTEGNIDNRIHELRTQNDLTQQALADAVGVTRATVVALEKGAYNPSLELAFKVSRFFGVGIEDLFKFKPHSKRG